MNALRRVPRRVWGQVFAGCLTLTLVIAGFSSRFSFGMNAEKITCLPYRAYLIDHGPSALQGVRGGYFAFSCAGLMPFFKDGSPFLKQMGGVPGDRVDVDSQGIRINGKFFGPLNPKVLKVTHQSVKDVVRHETIPVDHYLMLGTTPESYDGRYWGYITGAQLQARAYPLW